MGHAQKYGIIKDIYLIQAILLTHQLKFHNDMAKIVDFSINSQFVSQVPFFELPFITL